MPRLWLGIETSVGSIVELDVFLLYLSRSF
jgi:hypothetical protein